MSNTDYYCDCALCRCRIAWKDKFVTIFRNLEQHDSDWMTNVLDSEVLVTICADCGNRFPARAIRVSFDDVSKN